MAKVDLLLHPQLLRGGSAEAAAMSRHFEREMAGLTDTVRAFIAGWNGDRIVADPDRFEREANGIVVALSERIRRAETQLYRHIPSPPPRHMVDADPRRA